MYKEKFILFHYAKLANEEVFLEVLYSFVPTRKTRQHYELSLSLFNTSFKDPDRKPCKSIATYL